MVLWTMTLLDLLVNFKMLLNIEIQCLYFVTSLLLMTLFRMSSCQVIHFLGPSVPLKMNVSFSIFAAEVRQYSYF